MACVLNLSRVTWRSSFVTGASSSVEERSAAGRLRNVAEHVVASVDSESPDTELRFAMPCFDIATVRVGMPDGGRLNAKLTMRRILLRGIELVANILGVDTHMAVLEYKDTCTQLLERVGNCRPFANASNCQVWEEGISEDFHTTCKLACMPLRVMPLLVCLYIAFEDVSAQVKRDLCVLTGEGAAYNGGMEHLYDDSIVGA